MLLCEKLNDMQKFKVEHWMYKIHNNFKAAILSELFSRRVNFIVYLHCEFLDDISVGIFHNNAILYDNFSNNARLI